MVANECAPLFSRECLIGVPDGVSLATAPPKQKEQRYNRGDVHYPVACGVVSCPPLCVLATKGDEGTYTFNQTCIGSNGRDCQIISMLSLLS